MKTTKVIYNLLIIFILSLTLTSCASRNNTQFKSQTWSENKKNISSIKNYSAKGKFAYVSSQNSFSAYFSLLQTNSNMTIEATNLIGINLFTIKITKNEISFFSNISYISLANSSLPHHDFLRPIYFSQDIVESKDPPLVKLSTSLLLRNFSKYFSISSSIDNG